MSATSFRERYQQMPWPQQLGNLASTLARLSSRCSDSRYDALVVQLLREAALFIEWSAPHVPAAFHPDLAAAQREVLTWWRMWPLDASRPLLALRARQMSDLFLRLAGFIPPPREVPQAGE